MIECETDFDCPDGARCIDLALQTANNPFESTKPGKRVCDCLSECSGLGGGAP